MQAQASPAASPASFVAFQFRRAPSIASQFSPTCHQQVCFLREGTTKGLFFFFFQTTALIGSLVVMKVVIEDWDFGDLVWIGNIVLGVH